jgi:cytochrome P450 PksS
MDDVSMLGIAGRGDDAVIDLAAPVMFHDPFPIYAELRRSAPVVRARSKQLAPQGAYLLTRHSDVAEVLTDPRMSSAAMVRKGSEGVMKYGPRMFRVLTDSMAFKDDPDHDRLRRLVSVAFTPKMVAQMASDIEAAVEELLDDLDARGTVDLVADFAVPLPLSVIARMLGVSDSERDAIGHRMARLSAGATSGTLAGMARAIPSALQLFKLIERLVEAARANPRDGLISGLVAATLDGDHLSDDETIAMIFLLMLAGHDTTSNLISSSAVALIDNDEQTQRLRDDDAVIQTAIEELLRFTTPVPCGVPRLATEDVRYSGVEIPAGSTVLAMIISANRDEAIFTDPNVLDLGRDPNRHLTFAVGKHFCLGNQLARLEARTAIPGLLRRFPNLRLAVPREQLRFKSTQSLRGLERLPVQLG